MIEKVLTSFGVSHGAKYEPYGNGLINNTWKVFTERGNYILQRVNTDVFPVPRAIADNILMIKKYLDQVAPKYFFIGSLATIKGDSVAEVDGDFYRLFPFVDGSITIDEVENPAQAYQAAKQFGKFTRMLDAFNPNKLNIAIKNFHNLPFRVEQYQEALKTASSKRLAEAQWAINEVARHFEIVNEFNQIQAEDRLTLRVIHHDTKINNVLLDGNTGLGICVIDLDTIMPGYFISDVGDMMRTYLSPSSEEDTHTENIKVRVDVFSAIYKGYMEEMGKVLTLAEKELFIYSGKFMIFMQALRFLTDFLNGDIYYKVSSKRHNLNRAENQIMLLNKYIESETDFNHIIHQWAENPKSVSFH